MPPNCIRLPAGGLRLGIDTVDIGRVRESLACFGDRFVARLFTADEAAYAASAPSQRVERLAARFAAKEAAIKAFGLTESGIDWREIEVTKQPAGHCELAFHGRAADNVAASGVTQVALSLSHDGDQACAVVVALAPNPETKSSSCKP